MLQRFKKTLIVITITTLSCPALWGMTGLDIMARVEKNNKNLKTMSAEVLMIITNESGKRERNFYLLKKHHKKVTKSLIKFFLPTVIKGTSLLTHSTEGLAEKLQWIYLPALKSLQQITGNKKQESFMGSDFTYSDVAGRQLKQNSYTLIKEDEKYYYIKCIPKSASDPYSKLNILVDKKMYVPVRIVFYDRKGNRAKTLSNNKIKKIGPIFIVVEAIMKNHRAKSQTLLSVSNVKRNIPISDNTVGIKGLRQ